MPFEDELGAALRHTGEGFEADRPALVAGGEQRGRRLVRRRRVAVVAGGALALAGAVTVGAFATGLVGGADEVRVAAPAPLEKSRDGGPTRTGTGKAVSAAQLTAVFKSLLPAGTLEGVEARGTADEPMPMVSGVFDDGKGKAAISVGLWRLDPKGREAADLTSCPPTGSVPVDGCTAKKLPGGSRLMVVQGYEYPDRREDTKAWRATLVTREGYVVDSSEYNAAAEKGAPISRTDPPLTPAQLERLVTSTKWRPALASLPAADSEPKPGDAPPPLRRPALPVLLDHLPRGLEFVRKEGGGEAAEAVVDDGRGRFSVTLQIQPGMGEIMGDFYTGEGASTLPDGTRMKWLQQPGEKGGEGVVWWQVDALRPDGLRVIASAFNTPAQHEDATRPEPGITMKELEGMALDARLLHDAR